MKYWQTWQQHARRLKVETYAIYLACRDPRTPWYAKCLAGCVAAYALSPIDLIPDFIPVIGYLDDLLLVPLGIALVLKLIPPQVLTECRQAAQSRPTPAKLRRWPAAVVIVLIWLIVAVGVAMWLLRVMFP